LIGTLINVAAVLIGGLIGLVLGGRVPERLREMLMDGVGLVVLLIGTQMALKTEDVLVVLGAILVGGILGEWAGIEAKLESVGDWLRRRLGGTGWPRFTEGFVAASVLFCVGPMAILGAINDGLRGDYSLLAVKSALDGISALAFASTMGVGVLFSSVVVLVYQGGISLLAGMAQSVLSDAVVREMTATGGIIILGIGLRLLQLRQVRVANYLPALIVAPLLVALTHIR
jgi:uncharacterized protein